MVVEGIMDALLRFVEFLFSWLDIPEMPQEVIDIMEQLKVYIVDSLDLLGFFFDMDFLKIIVGCWVTIFLAMMIYKIVMWVLNLISKFT